MRRKEVFPGTVFGGAAGGPPIGCSRRRFKTCAPECGRLSLEGSRPCEPGFCRPMVERFPDLYWVYYVPLPYEDFALWARESSSYPEV